MTYTKPANRLIVWRGPNELFGEVTHANRFSTRLRGLIGQKSLSDDEGLLITPCNQVHTLGMRYELDLVFMNKTGLVLRCVESIRTNRGAICRGAHHTLEVAAGAIQKHGICTGQTLQWTRNESFNRTNVSNTEESLV